MAGRMAAPPVNIQAQPAVSESQNYPNDFNMNAPLSKVEKAKLPKVEGWEAHGYRPLDLTPPRNSGEWEESQFMPWAMPSLSINFSNLANLLSLFG